MKEQNEHIDIDALIAKELSGEISISEKQQLKSWESENESNAAYSEEMREVWSFVPDEPIWQPNAQETNSAWAKVQKQTQQTPKVIRLPRMLAFAASLALIISLTWWFTKDSSTNPEFLIAQTDEFPETVLLADGSTVKLMPYSKLRYPEIFEGVDRGVSLNGAAEFNVESDKTHPFKIQSGNSVIEVLGTSFYVSQEHDSVFVEVTEGVVELYAKTESNKPEKESVKIHKDESAFNTSIKPVVLKQAQDYHLHDLYFEATPLADVISQLEETYGQSIEVENQELLKCAYSAKLSQVNLYEVLEMLSLIFDVEIIESDNQILITGQGC